MKKIIPVLIPFLALTACKKDHSSAPSNNPARYELVGYANHYNGAVTDSVALNYLPNNHLLNSYTVFEYVGTVTDSATYQLVYVNSEVARINIVSMTDVSYYNYHYNAANQLDSIKSYTGDNLSPIQTWAFHYNAGGQLSDEFVYGSSSLQDHYNYTYDASGNISEEFDSSFNASVSVDTLQYSNFDNKVNPLKAIPGFPRTTAPLPASSLQFFSSPNNYATIARSIEIAPGQYQINTTNFTYQYNVAGLPTAIINGMDTVRLSYKQL